METPGRCGKSRRGKALAYAVDLVVELGVDDPGKGKPPQPADYTALVVGSRSSAIPIGTLFHDPKLSDFLPAAVTEGAAPKEIADAVGEQVQRALVAATTTGARP
jgi:hypothetical protein